MTGFEYLIEDYPGDDRWRVFVESCAEGSGLSDDMKAFLPKLQDTDFEVVLGCLLGDDAKEWLEAQIPALNGYSPLEVLAKAPAGKLIIRALLMRMPN